MNTTETQFYKDLDLSLTPHPLTGDIVRKFDDDAIKRSLRILFLYNKWDFIFNPELNGVGESAMFENPGAFSRIALEDKVKWVVETYEPRIKIDEIIVVLTSDEKEYDVTVRYTIKNLRIEDQLTFAIQRVR